MPNEGRIAGLAKVGLTPKLGQAILAAITILGILGFLGSSIWSARESQIASISVLAESHDAASLAYSQRESFNVSIAFIRWGDGAISARDLQIARALLGQRLQVTTQNGQITYNILPADFRDALRSLDSFILQAKDVPIAQRKKISEAATPTLEFFLTHTRQMSSQLATVSLRDLNQVVKNRARAEEYLSFIFLLTVLTGLWLALWLMLDISRGFRRSRKLLQEEEEKVTRASKTLEVAVILDSIQNQVLSAKFEQLTDEELLEYISSQIEIYESVSVQFKVEEIISLHQSRRRLAEDYTYRTSHDHLTGILNRNGFTTAIENHAFDENLPISAGFFIDVDRFQRFNDALGYSSGDKILQQVAHEIANRATVNEIVARLESDDFVMFGSYASHEEARERALELQAAIEFTQVHKTIEMQITISVGLVIHADHTIDSQSFLHEGAVATQSASKQERSGFALYSKDQSDHLTSVLSEEFALRKAIRDNEFILFYQPVIRVSDRQVVGAEALIRWERPGKGLLMPAQFLPQIREAFLSVELGYWVVDQALRMRTTAEILIRQHELEEFCLGINIEAESLMRSDFALNVQQAISRTDVNPADIYVEISEDSLAIGDVVLDNLKQLRAVGIKISLDDFGVGYSNVIQAQTLPLDTLKIDKAFFPTTGLTDKDKQLVLDVVRMARTLGVDIVAEGVETQEALDFVAESGIEFIQGFYYSPAMREGEFWHWVRNRNGAKAH